MANRYNLFVSSTFQDMHSERDLLHQIVIPELLEKFSQNHIQIDIIDLRWGISTHDENSEQENTEKILRVCFDEIDRSKPLFIGFIGERYGWIPDANTIESSLLGYGMQLPENDPRLSITELEIQYALQSFEENNSCYFFIRNGLLASDIKDAQTRSIYFPDDSESIERCAKLKKYLLAHYPNQVFEYNCQWDSKLNCVCGLEQLHDLLLEKLGKIIESHIKQYQDEQESNTYTAEKLLQESVLQDIKNNTFGRTAELKYLEDFVDNNSAHELAVIAPSGFGKSSLMASFCDQLSKKDILTIPFFAGLTEKSRNFRFLAQYCYEQLRPTNTSESSQLEYSELKKRFLASLIDASEDRDIVIIVDAVDQFSDSEDLRNMDWIHDQLIPDNVKIIYSCLPGKEELFQKRSAEIFLMDALDIKDIPSVANGIARKLHKEIPEEAMELLINKKDKNGFNVCRVPIYLVSLLELLCSFDAEDYAQINASQHLQNLSPSAAITKYISDTVRHMGVDIYDIINALSKKSKNQLGKKYEIITALLASSQKGITENEILGITSGTPYAVSSTDFSTYRRMFRMHLQQREDGYWCFTHAIIRNALLEESNKHKTTELWEQAIEYYLHLEETSDKKYPGLIHACAQCNNFQIAVDNCFSENFFRGASELYSWAVSSTDNSILKNSLLYACNEDQCFRICDVLSEHINEVLYFATEDVVELCLACISAMLKNDYHKAEHISILSKYYFFVAADLLHNGDSRCHSFFEICLKLLESEALSENTVIAEKALEISELFNDRQDWFKGEKYAKIAYRYANKAYNSEKTTATKQLVAQSLFTIGKCIMLQPLRINKTTATRYLYRAVMLAQQCQNQDLMLRAALMYLRSSRLFQNKQHLNYIEENIVSVSADEVNSQSYVELLLYRARKSNNSKLYAHCYSEAISSLARDGSTDAMVLYKKAALEYGYQLMLDENADASEALQVMTKTERICRKLDMVTSDIQWNDERLSVINDLDAYCFAKGLSNNTVASHNEIEARSKSISSRKGIKTLDAKNNFISLTLRLGLLALFVVFIITMGLTLSNTLISEQFNASNITMIIYNLLETAANVIAVLAMTFLALMLRNMDKKSFDHSVNSKMLSRCILIVSAFLGMCFFLLMFYMSDITVPYQFDRYFFPVIYTFFLSVVFTCSITWFIARIAAYLVHRSKNFTSKRDFRFLFRRKQWWKTHIFGILFLVVTVLFFCICFLIKDIDQNYNQLTFNGLTPLKYLPYCWIPIVIQIVLSVIEYISLRRIGKSLPSRTEDDWCLWKKPLLIFCICLVMLTATQAITTKIGKELQFKEHGYRVHNGMFYSVDDTEVRIYNFIGPKKNIRVPDKLCGKPVTQIASKAFAGSEIKSIRLPSNMISIEDSSFEECLWLESVKLPSELKSIGAEAFKSCSSLKEISFSENLESIGESAFRGCVSLEKADYNPNNVALGLNCFSNTGISFFEKINENGEYRVQCDDETNEDVQIITDDNGLIYTLDTEHSVVTILGCTPEATDIAIDFPNNSIYIEEKAFMYHPSLTSLSITGGCESPVTLSDYAFYGCTSLKKITLNGKFLFYSGCFANCRVLKEIDASEADISFKSEHNNDLGVFENCISLKHVQLPKAENLSTNLFLNCIKLETVELGLNLKAMNEGCFKGCISIKEVVYSGTVNDWSAITIQSKDAHPFYKCGYASLIIDGEKVTEVVLNESVTEVGQYAFFNYRALEKVVFKADSVIIKENAFNTCQNLKNISNFDRVTSIGKGAFSFCYGLTELEFSEHLTYIGSCAFEECYGIEEVNIPISVRKMGNTIFQSCDNLKRVTLGDCWEGREKRILGENINPEIIFKEME